MFHLSRAAMWSCLCLIAMLACANGEAGAKSYPDCNLVERIDEARRLLESSPGLRYDERRPAAKVKLKRKSRNDKAVSAATLLRQEIVLAVLDRKTDHLFTANFWLDADDITRANRLRATCENDPNLPVFHPYNSSRNFEVVVNRWNTYNSDLTLKKKGKDDTGRYFVLANKYLVPSSRLAAASPSKGKKYIDIVYAPYSRAIHSDRLIDAGKAFLIDQVERAFADLEKKKVKSHAYPSKLVTDTISQRFIKHLLINEHSDPRLMLAADDKGRQIAERFLILLAANGERAFRYTNSKTGATGIAQIMPKIYDHVVVGYPKAGLIKNTDLGRSDIGNAIKASVLVCDDLMATVMRRIGNASTSHKKSYRRLFDGKSEDEINEIRAAIYNGGPGKYLPTTGSICPRVSETVFFVRKFNLIKALNLFDDIPEQTEARLKKGIGLKSQGTASAIGFD